MGLLQLKTNTQIENEKQKDTEDLLKTEEKKVIESSLAGHLRRAWEEAKRAKIGVEQQILKNIRQITGEYDPEKLQQIREFGGSEAYLLYTQTKWRSANAWISDVLSDIPFDLEPTPKPSLGEALEEKLIETFMDKMLETVLQGSIQSGTPIDANFITGQIEQALPELREGAKKVIMDYAKTKAQEMKDQIQDQLIEGDWYKAIEQIIPDIFMKCGILKGPIMRIEKQRKMKLDDRGIPTIYYENEKVPQYERRPSLDIYPGPGVTSFQKGYFFDRLRYTPTDIQGFLGLPGFDNKEIRAVLAEVRESGSKLREWTMIDVERAEAEQNDPTMIWDWDEVDCLEYHGPIQGKLLHSWSEGMKKKAPDEDKFYDVEAYLIGNHIIKAVLNPDPLGERNYSKSSFINLPDSFFGLGLPEVIQDIAGAINSCIRALCNNVGMACLTGDTIVYREGQDRKYAAVTLNELWDKKQKHNSGLRRIKLRSLNTDTGEFFGNKIVDVYNNGVADIYELITERGYRIKATGIHKFMNDAGEWQELDEFDIGDLVVVNGQSVPLPSTCIDCGETLKTPRSLRCPPCSKKLHPLKRKRPPVLCIECGIELKSTNGWRCRSCASQINNSKWNQTQVEVASQNFEANAVTARGRFDCQSKKKDFCEVCAINLIDEPRLENHHKDRVPWNNIESNLQTLCPSCHHALHAKEDSFGDAYLHRYVSYDTIVSIEYVGQETVYNLQMVSPYHNFVSNGFCSKNSGPQVTIDESVLSAFEKGEMTPWKRWWVKYQEGISRGTVKAIEFYQPPLVAQQLTEAIKFLMALGDEFTIPAYAHGNPQIGGAGTTAAGFSMFQTASSRGIKLVLKNMDGNIIEDSIQRQFNWNMDRKKFSGLVGDMKIVAKGVRSLIVKEQQAARMNELAGVTSNAVWQQVLGPEGLSNLLKAVIKSHDINPLDIKTDWKVNTVNPMALPDQAKPMALNEAGDKTQGKDFQTIQGVSGSPNQ